MAYSYYQNDDSFRFVVVLGILCVVVALVLSPIMCVAPEQSREALNKMGFTDIKTKGFAWFSCGDDYTYSTKFEAKNANGVVVDGVVCCGVMKGCSIKF